MLQWTKTVLYYEFGWKFSSWFSFRFMVTYYRCTDDVCYTLRFPWVTYYQGNEGPLDFISAKFSLVAPKGICFFTFHVKEELLWNRQLYLHVCHISICQSVTFVKLPWVGLLLWRGKDFSWSRPKHWFCQQAKMRECKTDIW